MRKQHVGPARKTEVEKQRLDNTIERLKSSDNSEQKHSWIENFSLKKIIINNNINKERHGRAAFSSRLAFLKSKQNLTHFAFPF